MMVATEARQKAVVRDLLSRMTVERLPAEHVAVERMVSDYRAKYGLGPRDRATERATAWYGIIFDGLVRAVFGDRHEGRTMEVTDAYFDGTLEGKIAFGKGCYAYRDRLNAGEYDSLIHTILYANKDHWEAVIRETGDPPAVLVFVHRRKV